MDLVVQKLIKKRFGFSQVGLLEIKIIRRETLCAQTKQNIPQEQSTEDHRTLYLGLFYEYGFPHLQSLVQVHLLNQ